MSRPRVAFARGLRRDSTDAEKRLWRYLRGRRLCGVKFRRQHPVGRYVADFACPERGLIVELDGGQHARSHGRDARRDRLLGGHGYRVLRFWDHDVLSRTQAVLDTIYEALCSSPQPSPQRGEGEEERTGRAAMPSSRRGEGKGEGQ
jgi:very-short-patch-repair endonuclease